MGWLDNYGKEENYNDSHTSAPKGFEGEGTFNGPQWESPAWGGQFQNGGKAPLYVESKNDPRYKAYQDSTALYKSSLKNMWAEKTINKSKVINKGFIPFDDFKTYIPGSNIEVNDLNVSPAIYKGEHPSNSEKAKKDFEKWRKTNTAVSSERTNKLIKNGIKPTGFNINEWKSDSKDKPTINYSTVYKKPEQEVIFQRPQEKFIQLNSKPGESNFNLEADVPTIRPQAKLAKYFDVTDSVNQNFGGSESHYKYYPENGPLQELAPEPYNSRKIVPHYQDGGKTFLQPTSDKLPEGYMKGSSIPSTERAMSIGGENGEPAYLIPSFKYGQELLGPVFDPISEFRRTGEHLGGPFKTWQEADEWERTVRHPAVENRETIMFPQEQFQMGGNLPGATGSMYARVGAPSNGPYAKKTMASAQNGTEMRYYQNGLDWKPKGMRDGGWLDGYEKGGVIKDDRGQWDHPREITEIGSNNITMEGVPYPVLGISDTGHTQMMYPGNLYKFKGKKVTEYPIAKNGVNQADENSLVKLDQLTNFTNYNTKQPGGWLDTL